MEKFNQKQRMILSLYIVWAFMNLIFLTMAEDFFDPDVNYFWPIKMGDGYSMLEGIPVYYDFTEFIVYVGSPIIIYLIYILNNKKTKSLINHT